MRKFDWRRFTRVQCGLFIITILNTSAYAMLDFSGRGEGLARSYSVFANGFDAVEWNPANLAVAPEFSFNILSVGLEFSSNIGIGDLMKIYTHGYFNDDDKKIFQNGLLLDASGGAQAVSFSWRNLAFTSSIITKNDGNIPTDLAKMVFWGNIPEVDSIYNFDGTHATSEITLDAGMSLAQTVAPGLALGATLKYLQGFSYLSATLDGGLKTTMDAMSGNGTAILKYAEGGTGYGIDFGLLYYSPNYSMGVSLINALSGINWNQNPRVDSLTFLLKPTTLSTFSPDTSAKWDTVTTTNGFSTKEDMELKVGCSVNTKRVNVEAEMGYPELFGVGAEMPCKAVVFRAGLGVEKDVSSGNSEAWMGLGIGTKVRLLHTDIGIRSSSTTRLSVAIAFTILPEEKVDKAFKYY